MRDLATAARGSRSSALAAWLRQHASTHLGTRPRSTPVDTTWRGEARAIGVVTGLVLAITVFRAVLVLGTWFLESSGERFDAAQFVTSCSGDFAMHFALALLMYVVIQPVRRAGPQAGAPRVLALAAALVLAATVASAAREAVRTLDGSEDSWLNVWVILPRFLFPGAMLVTVAEFHRRELLSMEAMRAARAARDMLETQTLQARVRTLEAQIEPHFLFNTLATVRRLYETDPKAGDSMMGRLMDYLHTALPSMRGNAVTLAREADLIGAYLDLQKVRMGRRLEYRVDVPPSLHAVEVPPMMLLTLVENAIKHGLAPEREGGRIDVTAETDGASLKLHVADTGRGFGTEVSGGGTGLANIRARLGALYGAAAALTLAPRDPRGLVATLTLPAGAAIADDDPSSLSLANLAA